MQVEPWTVQQIIVVDVGMTASGRNHGRSIRSRNGEASELHVERARIALAESGARSFKIDIAGATVTILVG
jgi:hypothetical protein